jgi:hypothetical protein
MYLVLDKRAPWRYTRGPFVFLDGLKSRLRQRQLFHSRNTNDHPQIPT